HRPGDPRVARSTHDRSREQEREDVPSHGGSAAAPEVERAALAKERPPPGGADQLTRPALASLLLLLACNQRSGAPASCSTGASTTSGRAVGSTSPSRATDRRGGVLRRSPNQAVLWLADEDHIAVRRIPIEAAIGVLPPLPEPSKEKYMIVPGVDRPGPAEK